jgi:2-(3-amino-3-carboxypropyl)histidine synthase
MELKELLGKYDLEFDRVMKEIKTNKAKRVLFQFPDGLKPYATEVVDYFEAKVKGVLFFIWLGSCYGACDTPVGLEGLDIDLIVQFGHNEMMPSY